MLKHSYNNSKIPKAGVQTNQKVRQTILFIKSTHSNLEKILAQTVEKLTRVIVKK